MLHIEPAISQINRELNIATNPPTGSTIVLPKTAYFKNAKFLETTMTTSNGSYVAMNQSNSVLLAITADTDPGTSSGYSVHCDSIRSSSQSGNFIQDTASCTFCKTTFPI